VRIVSILIISDNCIWPQIFLCSTTLEINVIMLSYTTPMHRIHRAAFHLVLCDDATPQFVVIPEELRGTDPVLVYHNPDRWMNGGMKSYARLAMLFLLAVGTTIT